MLKVKLRNICDNSWFPVMRKLGSWEHQCSERKHEWNEEKKTGILYRFSFERCHKFLVAKVFQPRFTTRNGDQVSWLPRPGVKRVANLGVKPAWEHSLCYAVVWNKSDLKHVGHYKIAKRIANFTCWFSTHTVTQHNLVSDFETWANFEVM